MSGTLILVRHGESEWNQKNLFTGWKNPDLTEKGIEEARRNLSKMDPQAQMALGYFDAAKQLLAMRRGGTAKQ